jgi:antitoxin component of MazEF toxin-antitoxin module
MKIIETTVIVEDDGSVLLPDDVIRDIGLYSGDEVRVAYMPEPRSVDGAIPKDVFVSRLGLMDLSYSGDDTDEEISIPRQLMDAARLTADIPIVVYCENGRIVIEADELGQLTANLIEVSDALSVAINELV